MVLVYLPRKLGDFGQGQMLMCIFQHHGMGSIFYCVLVKNMLKQQISTSNLHPIFGMEKKKHIHDNVGPPNYKLVYKPINYIYYISTINHSY